ncbi:ABC transporter permease [Paenibacillus prosopidis]|uniref:Carbohydrate ABC transporter membrane protein 1 (CUT1 family) n=1 Tax=Paenibacillus prosopidis TaxID=630520 RepID=A0A368VZW1_9BACL|nr:ABC transporter permease subunit [Paenibacillus prosopidis]RCW47499.1 carbohydrate ABC transporter membrane protein 1 (CUT1 family) [Paenibacillus prosopidis]
MGSTAKRWKRFTPLFLLMIPGLAYLIVNNYLPMFGMIIAFKDVNFSKGILGSDWIGFKNFEYLFKTADAYIITRNTILYNGAFIVINTIGAVSLAILLNEIRKKFFQRFYQSIVILPHLISMVIVSYLVYAMLSSETGLINKSILPLLGVDPIAWYSNKEYWPYILTIVNIWKGIGFLSVVYLASIISIDPEYYEAATIDGASKWHQIRSITFPLITPVITMMTLLAIGRIFHSDFGLFYQVPMDSGVLSETTNVIDTYVYRALMNLGDIGMSSAAGVYQSVVGFVLVILSNYAVRKFSKDNALF